MCIWRWTARTFAGRWGGIGSSVQDDWIRARLRDYAKAGVGYLRDGGDKLGVARAGGRSSRRNTASSTARRCFPICRKGRYGAFIGRTYEDFDGYRALVDEAISRRRGTSSS